MALNTSHFYLNVLLSTKFVIRISATAVPQNEKYGYNYSSYI